MRPSAGQRPGGRWMDQPPSAWRTRGIPVAGAVRCIRHPRETLFREAEDSDCLFRIVEGQVKLSVNSSSGRRIAVAMAGPGELLDLASVMMGNPYCVTAESVYPSVIAKVSKDKLNRALSRRPKLYELLMSEMVAQYNVFCGTIRLLGLSTSVQARLANLLLQWGRSRGERTSDGVRIRVAITQEEIGEFIGASRETIARALSEFRELRLLEMHGSTILVHNLDDLALFATA